MPDSYPQPGTFRIAIICALGKEANAVDKLFDKWWEPEELEFMQSNSAPKNFRVGCMKHHYVVLARCGKAGKVDAAVDAHAVRQTFPNIEIVLVAGICGGKRRRKDALGKEISISLGDIILGMEVLQYDVGKSLETGFDPKPAIKLDDSIHKFMEQLKSPIDFASLKGKARDHFKDTFSDSLETVPEANKIYDPGVHFGVVASGDMVIKSEKKRDSIKRSISDPGDDPIGFEMEASGVENVYRGRVIVIKSVCDYADKDKHKTYQEIAAMWSAAYTRAFLDKYQPGPRNLKQRVTEGMTEMRTKVSEVVNGETHLGEKVNGSLKEAVKTTRELFQKGPDNAEPNGGQTTNSTLRAIAPTPMGFAPMFRPMTPTTMVGPTTPTTQEQSIPQERRITSPLPAAGLTPPATPDNIGLPLGHPTSTQPPEASGLVAAPPRAGPPTGLVGPQVATPPISRSPTLNTWSDSQSETQIQTETEDESSSFKSSETLSLFEACEEQDLVKVNYLLDSGQANAKAIDSDGNSMLHLAIGETKLGVSEIEDVIKIIRKLLRGGALIDNQDRHLRSPMHLCIASMNTKAAECLIAHNADPNILDEDKYTPLDRLAAHRSPDERLAILLVNNGAKLGPGNWPPLIQGPNFKRQASVRATLRRAGRVGV